ncbi:hypothetical protein [Streptomyces sp. NPDC002537]
MAILRNALGSLLALAGAVAAVWSPFRPWYAGRRGTDYGVRNLFRSVGVTGGHADLLGSLFAPMLVAALVALLGLLKRSRPLLAAAGVLVLGFTVLWAVRQGQVAGSLSIGDEGHGLNAGGVTAFTAGCLLLLAAAVTPGGRRPRDGTGTPPPYERPPHERPPHEPPSYERPPYEQEPVEPPPYAPPPGTPPEPPPWPRPPHDAG